MGNLEEILGKSWEYLGEILMKSGENHGEIMRKSWKNLGEIFGVSLENLWQIAVNLGISGWYISGGYLKGIWGMS